jgi:hypothetical protein
MEQLKGEQPFAELTTQKEKNLVERKMLDERRRQAESELHQLHKRQKVSLLQKQQDDLQEGMAGPSLDLFMPQELKPAKEPEECSSSDILPVSHSVKILAHNKAVQALTIDKDGTKMATGSLDYQLKIFDFDTMNQNLRPYKDFKPFDGHPVIGLSWSPSSNLLLVCCPNTQARIYSSDGVKK